MRHVSRWGFVLMGGFFLTSCSSDNPAGLGDRGMESRVGPNAHGTVRVMTRNMYIGTNVDAVIAALASPDPNDDFPALLAGISTLQETDFPTRVKALADEIALNHPHAVGLQEVSDLSIDLTGLGVPFTLSQDFLTALTTELAGRGLNYIVAAEVTNSQATPIPGISLIDHDALLVDGSRVTLGSVKVERNYAFNIGVVAPGVNILRGFVMVDATIDGKNYLLADTHLESGSAAGLDQLRGAQAQELSATIGAAPSVLVMGDFNDIAGSLMYQVMAGSGFTDLWVAIHPTEAGLTCCHLANLANETATFDQRIDYVFARGVGRAGDPIKGAMIRTGASRNDRIPGPIHSIWPSDHAGLVATVFTVPGLAVPMN